MERSEVYPSIHYMTTLRDASDTDRKRMLQNVNVRQLTAIGQVAKRLINGTINPLRRDVRVLERRRMMLKAMASARVSADRKKSLVKRYHSVIPVMLNSVYLIQTVLDEVKTC